MASDKGMKETQASFSPGEVGDSLPSTEGRTLLTIALLGSLGACGTPLQWEYWVVMSCW